MPWLFGLIGLFCGALFGASLFGHGVGIGIVFGALAGVLFGRISVLHSRVSKLEDAVATQQLMARSEAVSLGDQPAPRRAPPPVPAAPTAAAPPPASRAAMHPVTEPPSGDLPPFEYTGQKTPAATSSDAASPPIAANAAPPQQHAPVATSGPATTDFSAASDFDLDFSSMATPPPPPAPQRAVFTIGEPPPARPQPQPRMQRPVGAATSIPPRAARADTPDPLARAFAAVKRWFTEGNIPVKIGVLILFLGVGALMKYAADQGWFYVPIEVRLAGIAAAALAGLVFGWRKRESHRAFALSLQGGAIGILLLVVFGSYKLYHLLPPGLAFLLLVLIVGAAGIMAVAQDALALALLAIVGGFLAPVLTASDSGNHVALFTYYAVLNAAILGIAWVKPWRALNLLGFVFTFGIGTAWGFLKYRPELFATTEPFLILFYAFYLAIPLLYALRQPEERRGFVDGSLVFGTPLLAFPLQAALLDGDTKLLALSALVLALTHIGIAWYAFRRLSMTLLGQSHALLALGFATLAVPLALSARATACAWAVEGAALIWLGLRQQRQLPRVIGYLLQLAAGLSLISVLVDRSGLAAQTALLNGDFLAILLLSAAGFTSSALLRRASETSGMAQLMLIWALGWWLALGCNEIDRFASPGTAANWLLGFVALTTLLTSEGARRLLWNDLRWPALLAIFAAPLFIVGTTAANGGGPLSGPGLAAWLGWFAASLWAQRNLDATHSPGLSGAYAVHVFTWTGVLATQLTHLGRDTWQLSMIWQVLLGLAPFALAFAGTLGRWRVLRLPLDVPAEMARAALLGILSTLLGTFWVIGLIAAGDPAPLPYLPIANPLELAQLGFVLALLHWLRQANAEGNTLLDPALRAQLLAILGFALMTSMTLRAVHFLGGVDWNSDAMLRSALAQACLSVIWCTAGLAAMLTGARRRSRPIWIGGACLVGLVIVKLILIDRTHLKDLYAILGVLAVGSLLMLVGYFAPNPPRQAESES
ncbi:MAG: DUF2339 domain-containing protein [Rhodanobacteraceae bacterium]|nr:DUF2339 domain-containing protein [Rhodanobacteraceae bacterium]